MDYQKGKIYKIESHVGPKIYIGSTTKQYLSQRMEKHRSNYKSWKKGEYGLIKSFELFDEYGLENCQIILLESCPCNSKDELNAKEAHYIRSLPCINKYIPGRSIAEWRNDNKEQLKEKAKQYSEINKDKIKEYSIMYNKINKEKIKEQKSVPFKCDCGSCFRRDDKARHERTKKHLNYLASKTE